jgi:hypothetical protein
MKVVTWNIDFKTDKSKLWDYIDQEIHPDILLVQECRNFPSIYQGIGDHIGGSRSWGSVVLSKKYILEPCTAPFNVDTKNVSLIEAEPAVSTTAVQTQRE